MNKIKYIPYDAVARNSDLSYVDRGEIFTTNIPMRMVIAGESGSGKTTLIESIFNARDSNDLFYLEYSDVLLFSNSENFDGAKSYSEIARYSLDQFKEERTQKNYHLLVVFDDPVYTMSKNVKTYIEDYFRRSRNLKTSVIMTAQSIDTIPKEVIQNKSISVLTKSSEKTNEIKRANFIGDEGTLRAFLSDPKNRYLISQTNKNTLLKDYVIIEDCS